MILSNITDKSIKLLMIIGRRGTLALTITVFIGIFIPPIGTMLKPFLSESIFILLCISFLRMDINIFKKHIKKPKIILLSTLWTALVIPLLVGTACTIFDLKELNSDIYLGFMLQSISSPMMATPALAALMGLDATLVLITMITSTILVPFTVPLFAYYFLETSLNISPFLLGLKLFVLIASSAIVGLFLRKLIGQINIDKAKEKIDGINILILFVFVAGIMTGVANSFFNSPMLAIILLIVAFLIFFILFFLTVFLFLPSGKLNAYSLGFMISQRNMGLMIAALGESLPNMTLLYFAISQFPIYLSPQVLKSLIEKLRT